MRGVSSSSIVAALLAFSVQAPASAARILSPTPPRLKQSADAYFAEADYPPTALAARRSGRVTTELLIGKDGRVTGCAITISSGFAALDAATCRIFKSRARFIPARDAAGNAVPGGAVLSHVWRLPGSTA
jgi:protein TonB